MDWTRWSKSARGWVGILDGCPVGIGRPQAELAGCQLLPTVDEFPGPFHLIIALGLETLAPAGRIAILDAMHRIKSLRGDMPMIWPIPIAQFNMKSMSAFLNRMLDTCRLRIASFSFISILLYFVLYFSTVHFLNR